MNDIYLQRTCKNCGNQFSGKYCNQCGEKVYTSHDKSVLHFFEEGFHFITHLEGTLFTTIKTMFRSPGRLSYDYCEGTRKRYFKPLSFFLLLIVLYLLFPVFEGLNMNMKYYPQQSLYGNYAAAKIQATMARTGLSEAALSEKFHVKAAKISKFMLLIIVPFTALYFMGIAFFKRKYFFDHMVFAAEINSFYLLWGFLLLPVVIGTINFFTKIITGHYFSFYDQLLGILIYGVVCIYAAMAAHKFYSLHWWQSVLFGGAFFIVHSFIVYSLYKFLLFAAVINQIH